MGGFEPSDPGANPGSPIKLPILSSGKTPACRAGDPGSIPGVGVHMLDVV